MAREAERLSVQGTAAGARVRIIATKTSIDAQAGERSFNATRDADGNWRQANMAGGATNFRFTGSAADPLTRTLAPVDPGRHRGALSAGSTGLRSAIILRTK